MYFQQSEHNPPHIHGIYGGYVAAISINDLTLLEAELPNKAMSLVVEWMIINKEELLHIWNTQEFKRLPPLE